MTKNEKKYKALSLVSEFQDTDVILLLETIHEEDAEDIKNDYPTVDGRMRNLYNMLECGADYTDYVEEWYDHVIEHAKYLGY